MSEIANPDDLPAPRISRQKGLDLGMVADGKLPLKAFDEHAAILRLAVRCLEIGGGEGVRVTG